MSNPPDLAGPSARRGFWLAWGLALGLIFRAGAAPAFDTTTPASFFTNAANLVLQSETADWQAQDFAGFTNTFGATTTNGFGLTNIPVYINGSFVYASSIQRLLQVAANIYEALSTNAYPEVYRPAFYRDFATGNIFINGYQLVTTVSGPGEPALSAPVDVSALAASNVSNLANVNVYGVPWIIGARHGFPSFNELYMLNAVQVTRRLQVTQPPANGTSANVTNQMYIVSITNEVGMSFWNSYYSNYTGSGNLTIAMQDTMAMVLTNATRSVCSPSLEFSFATNFPSWPGSAWASLAPNAAPASFVSIVFTNVFLPPSQYLMQSGMFINLAANPVWETNLVNLNPLPQFGLMTTNWAQAYVLDGPAGSEHVIDYVQFSGPNSTRDLNFELEDPAFYGMWSTNVVRSSYNIPFGVFEQILYSIGAPGATIPVTELWNGDPALIAQEQAYFRAFCSGNSSYIYNDQVYPITVSSMVAPYTPTRTTYDYTLWQANDPLVHYVATDLNYLTPGLTGLIRTDNGSPLPALPGSNLNQAGPRYQPWGLAGQMMETAGVDTNANNLAFRDPLVWGSDYWNFPTNQSWNPDWLGQIHRGTPWQTIYLKSTNLLALLNFPENTRVNGASTWEVWAGNTNLWEAERTAPVNDWHLAALLTAILNTNTSLAYFSVNNPDPNAWVAEFDGVTAVTNSSPYASILLSSNSPAVAGLAAAMEFTRSNWPSQEFQDVGDFIATPQLTIQSPFLDWSDPAQQQTGITDAAYEQIPSQLLAQMGIASAGTLTAANGRWTAQFTGAAGHSYRLQASSDLAHWGTIATNSPVNGSLSFPLPPSATGQFYRTMLLP